MTALAPIIAWCKTQRTLLKQQLERLESGRVHTSETRGILEINTTTETIQRVKGHIAELDHLLADTDATEAAKAGQPLSQPAVSAGGLSGAVLPTTAGLIKPPAT